MLQILLPLLARWNQLSLGLRSTVVFVLGCGFVMLLGFFFIYIPNQSIRNAQTTLDEVEAQWVDVQRTANEAKALLKGGDPKSQKAWKDATELQKVIQESQPSLGTKDIKFTVLSSDRLKLHVAQVNSSQFKNWLNMIRVTAGVAIDKVMLQATDQGLEGDIELVLNGGS